MGLDERLGKLSGAGPRVRFRIAVRPWPEMLEALTAFKRQHGHCCVQRDARYPLGAFVHRVRAQYRARSLRSATERPLPDAQVAELEAIGFEWTALDRQEKAVTEVVHLARVPSELSAEPRPADCELAATESAVRVLR